MYLLVTYVPEESLENVKSAIFTAGAGKIGNYSSCSWEVEVKGQGQFKPEVESSPFLGEVNKLEKTDEYRLELVCPDRDIKDIVRAMLKAHPYETPAYHLVKVLTLDDLE